MIALSLTTNHAERNDVTVPPLSGIKVLDLSTLLPGPLATLMLAEAGADVVKLERPGQGDEMLREALLLTARNYYYLPIHHQMRPWVMKKSVTTVHKSDDRPESRFAVVKP